jgi:RHS repeat-associated protein
MLNLIYVFIKPLSRPLVAALILLVPGLAQGQNIIGNTCVVGGTDIGPYTINGVSWSTADKWCVTNGTIDGPATSCMNNNGNPSIGITWSSGSTTGTVSYYHPATATTPIATLTVNMLSPGGMTGGNPYQPYNTPVNLTFTSNGPATSCGGYGINYSWQEQIGNGAWNNYSGSTNTLSLTLTGVSFTTSVNFRRGASFAGGPSGTVYTSPYPVLIAAPGTISPASQTVNSNGTPVTLTATAAQFCNGSFTYTWYSSPDGTNWTSVGGGLSYSPPVPPSSPYFYRIGCLCTGTGSTVYSTPATITVFQALTSGTVSPATTAINNNSMAPTLVSTPPTGGTGTYAYQWQSSTTAPPGNFQNVTTGTGTNTLSYSPGVLTSNMWYKLITFNNGGSVTSNTVAVTISPTLIYGVTAPNNPVGTADNNLNWIIARTFDDGGHVIGESKKFFDNSGSLLQSQSKVFYRGNATTTYTHVLATQPLNDAYGRPVATTLPAPIDYSDYSYRPNFVQAADGTNYTYKNFDQYNPISGPVSNKTITPDPIGGQAARGTLGWYYGANNYWEPYTATSNYPYSRFTFYQDGTGNKKKQGAAGEAFSMGSTHEISSYITPVSGELSNYLAIRNQFFATGSPLGALPANLQNNAIISVVRDANGNEGVSISDRSGKVLMTATPGTDLTANNTVSVAATLPLYTQQLTATGTNIALQTITQVNPSGSHFLNVYLISSSGVITSFYSGLITFYPTNTLGNGTLVVQSDVPFIMSYTCSGVNYTSGSVTEPGGTLPGFGFFKILADNTPVSISGNYTLYDMNTELPVSLTGGQLNRGYYKVVATSGVVNVNYSNGFSEITYIFYNQLGEMVASIAPNGVKLLLTNGLSTYPTLASLPFLSLFNYDSQGRLIGSSSPDGGASQTIYRMDGKLRFFQSSVQVASGSYNYINYDQLGRIIETGQYQPDANGPAFNSTAMNSAAVLENVSTGGLTTGTKTDVVQFTFDAPDGTHGQSGYSQDAANLAGQLSTSKRYSIITPGSSTLVCQTWYNYNEEGKVSWMIKYIASLGSLGYKTTDYSYDNLSRLTKKIFQKNSTSGETFVHYFIYDAANGNLWKVWTANSDVGPGNTGSFLQATYLYYLHGGIKRVELGGNMQGLDYTYTLQGALKAINNTNKSADPNQDGVGTSSFLPDAYGEVLDYYPGDYTNSHTGIQTITGVNTAAIITKESYTGNLKAMSWFSEKPTSATVTDAPVSYIYQYDSKYQFTNSTWGTVGVSTTPMTFTSTTINQEMVTDPTTGLPAYDNNGNILNLRRTDNNGALSDQFIYKYANNNNQLTSILNGPLGSTPYATYSYDASGREISENLGNVSLNKYIQYDITGRVKLVATDNQFANPLVRFVYDETGQRIEKMTYNSSGQVIQNTFYFGDVVYTQQVVNNVPSSLVAQEYQISGMNGRIGVYYKATGAYAYELTDHLGNVRAVIMQGGSPYQVKMYNDYYPFGLVIGIPSNAYRYGFQGQNSEADGETGWNAYSLRMYNPRIARWFAPDTKNQYSSPYIGMGNDPLKGIDKDGGSVDSADDIIFLNKKHKEIARIINGDPNNQYVNVDIDRDFGSPFLLDIRPSRLKPKIDAIGFGGEISATDIVGGTYGFEFVYFLKGNYANQLFGYSKVGVNLGEEVSAGIYGFEATFNGENSAITPQSWEGIFNSWSAGGGEISGGYFWSNSNGSIEFLPGTWLGMGSPIAWEGVTVSGAIPGIPLPEVKIGFKWSAQDYQLLSPLPVSKWFNSPPPPATSPMKPAPLPWYLDPNQMFKPH